MVTYTNVSARALRVSLHISQWNAARFDRTVSDELTKDKHAAADHARVNKHLFGTKRASRLTAPEFAAVKDAAEALYLFHIVQTLPWSGMGRNGQRLLPTSNYMTYTDGIRTRGNALRSAASDFIDVYPRLKAEAMLRLGDLAKDGDFLDDDVIAERFSYDVAFSPVPSTGDIRVDLPADQIDALEADVTSRVESATRLAMDDAWKRLHDAVARIRKAASTDGVVRSNLIDSVREVCDVLARLNIADDERLNAMRRKVEIELTSITVEDLRGNDAVRADTEDRAAKIMASMSAFYSPVAA